MCGSLIIEAAELTTADFAKLFPFYRNSVVTPWRLAEFDQQNLADSKEL
jgi:hypothetical protein